MLVKTNVELDLTDKLDFSYCINTLNTVHSYIVRPLPVDMDIEMVEEYYEGLMKKFKEAKVDEHKLRCAFSKKYNIPYDFSFDNGEIMLDDGK